ncbi:neuronal acetylcholine receptor subunit alpha-10-like [Stylophora pistillata]|nr:neuronal acetylcholine receptor subunit alpha-10-like [Stylophora pistillata]XP_022787610.1 neuronal acetylcholine receptor subunit alpha-10-like [Stylophora pistillata]
MRSNDIVFFIALLRSTVLFVSGALEVNETRLHTDLFKGYNKHAHPRPPGTGPVVVTFDFQLIRILDVSARSQYITTYAWVNQYWENHLLKWDPKDYGGVKEIHVSPSDIWVPDTLLYNNIDDEERMGGGRTTYTTNIELHYDGKNTWLNPAMFKSICSVDVTNFPFDDQECQLKFGSWAFDKSKIDLAVKNGSTLNTYYIKNGEWKMLNLSAKRNALKYQCCPHEFVDITVSAKIRRESLDYILKLIIPCSMISSMIFLGFVLPPESGERIGLSITVLLAMTVFQQLSSEFMPSYGFPLLGQFYFAIMLEIGLSLAVTTLILNFYHRNRRRMPKTMRKVILQCLARVLFPCQKPKNWNEIHRKSVLRRRLANRNVLDAERGISCSDSELCEEDEYVQEKSTRPDPNLTTWVVQESGTTCTLSPDGTTNGDHSFCNLAASPHNTRSKTVVFSKECFKNLKRKNSFRSRGKHPSRAGKKHSSSGTSGRQRQVDSQYLSGNVLDWTEEKLKNQKEWIKAARVLDRLFLIISIFSFIATLLTIFLRAPRFRLSQ